ncbi:hypothetical protein A7X67_02510 [Clostridium sp. W14A]|nr:hypothetical protein A7X67_02510 [Clostridium sp. W14A]
MKNEKKFIKLTNRELQIMQILWKSDKSLTATEISELTGDNNFSIFSVQNTIKSLLSKKVIEVSSYTKVYKTNAREYKPLLSANDFATMQFTHYFDPSKETAIPHLVATLLKLENTENESNVIDELEKMLNDRKKEIENEKSGDMCLSTRK